MSNPNVLMILISFLLWLLFSFSLSYPVNIGRSARSYYNFPIPILCFIVCVITMFFADQIASLVISFLVWLTQIVAFIPFIGRLLSSLLSRLYTSMITTSGIFVMTNLAVTSVYAGVKRLLYKFLRNYWESDQDIFDETSGKFYKKVKEPLISESGRPVAQYRLRNKYHDAKRLMGVLSVFSVLVCAGLGTAVSTGAISGVWAAPIYPAAGILLCEEIYVFLGGRPFFSKKPQEGAVQEAEPECTEIQESLKQIFGSRVIHDDHLQENKVLRNQNETEEILLTLEDDLEEIAETYFNNLISEGEEIHPDFKKASKELLRGNSLILLNPFYHDFSQYMMLPVIHNLLQSRKVLLICGRTSDKDNIKEWIEDAILDRTGLSKLWPVQEIDEKGGSEETNIGILYFQNLYNLEVLNNNKQFFQDVHFVILLEPSNMLGTGQIGLRNVLEAIETPRKKIVYCVIDRSADGLVDAMSHILRQSLLEVYAPPASEVGSCRILWQADGPGMQNKLIPGISKYLGFGTEVAVQAMSLGANPIGWYSNTKVPLLDLKWNVAQYYPLFCKYIGLELEQGELEDRLKFQNSLWQAEVQDHAFMLIEDEFCNAFDIARHFSSRITRKGFINIFSENYLLRDYMADNATLFTNDPKAIPTIVPDYARTERNFVIRMLLLMSASPVEESYINEQLSVHGFDVKNTLHKMQELIKKHTGIEKFFIQTTAILTHQRDFPATRYTLSISNENLNAVYNSALKSAFYVIENERLKTYPMGNRLMGQIEQTILPGQFFTWQGKYYQAVSISPVSGIIVRRSGDHFNKRVYYRQLRDYFLSDLEINEDFSEIRTIKLFKCFANIHVETDGYLEMENSNDLKHASFVTLSPSVKRDLYKKELLQIKFDNVPSDVLFTISLLLNELFRTLFPNETGYIVAFPSELNPEASEDPSYKEQIRALVPGFHADSAQTSSIYIVEDSHIDLGLLVAVERNFERIMEIITDYLAWSMEEPESDETEDASDNPEESGPKNSSADSDDGSKTGDQENKNASPGNSIESRTDGNISFDIASHPSDGVSARLFKRKKNEEKEGEPEKSKEKKRFWNKKQKDDDSDVSSENKPQEDNETEKTDIEDHSSTRDIDIDGEDEELIELDSKELIVRKPYLQYGEDSLPVWLSVEKTLQYLSDLSFDDSNLQRARKSSKNFGSEYYYDPNMPGVHYCDFCGDVLKPGQYDVLKDGRERCPQCSSEAVKTRRQFKKLFKETISEMESIFGIGFHEKLHVRMVNTKKVNEIFGIYKPTPGFDMRALGYAHKNGHNGENIIYLENGSPYWSAKSTIVHELSHIWQYENWPDGASSQGFGHPEQEKLISEGMAVWTEVQYLSSMGELERAIRIQRSRELSDDEYGLGLSLYLSEYKISEQSTVKNEKTPFKQIPPLTLLKKSQEAVNKTVRKLKQSRHKENE